MKKKMLIALALAVVALVAGPAAPAQAYPTSQSFHWQRRTVYVYDHTGIHWPVSRSATEWNESGAVQLRYRNYCRSGYPCIHVYSSGTRWSSCKTIGIAPMTYDPTRDRMLSAKIIMNRKCNGLSYAMRKGATVHELGHALGLAHNTWTGSIMYPGIGYRSTPSYYDHRWIRGEYAGLPW